MKANSAIGGVRKSTKRWLGALVLIMALAALAGFIKSFS